MTHTKLTEKDFICNGYNKYHLWTYLYYQYQINPKLQDLSRKERKRMAVNVYLKLLGKKDERLDWQ